MPTYQYACTECGHRFDAVQAFTDPALTDCPECSGRLRKLFGSVGVVFKGSGFYRTDSRTDSKSKSKTPAKAETSSSNGSSSNGSSTNGSSSSDSGSSSSNTSSSSASSSTSSSSATAKAS